MKDNSDPLLTLPLTIIQPGVDSQIKTSGWTGATPTGDPKAGVKAIDKPAALPVTQVQPSAGPAPMNLLDHIMFALTGTPDQMLSPEQRNQRGAKRSAASRDANQAMASTGEEYMQPPNAGGSGFGLNDIISGLTGGAKGVGVEGAAGEAAGGAGGAAGIAKLAQLGTKLLAAFA